MKPKHLQTEIYNDCIDQHNQFQLNDVSKIYTQNDCVDKRNQSLRFNMQKKPSTLSHQTWQTQKLTDGVIDI